MTRDRRFWFLLFVGLGGGAVLVSLSLWQVARLQEKNAYVAELGGRLTEAPVSVMGDESALTHNFRAAEARGRFVEGAATLRALVTIRPFGPGFRLIDAFELENGRRILIDRGYAPEAEAPRGGVAPPAPTGALALRGALHWPREAGAWTPAPNLAERIWFARDVDSLAAQLDAEPVLLVLAERAATQTARWPAPEPATVDLPNNHLSYALTWAALAAVWTAMSLQMARGAAGASDENRR